jgi:hypothetical protein
VGSYDTCSNNQIYAEHAFACCFSGDSGVDEWKLQPYSQGDCSINWYEVNIIDRYNAGNVKVDVTGTSDRIRVTWDYGFGGYIKYVGMVYGLGPAGVSCQHFQY